MNKSVMLASLIATSAFTAAALADERDGSQVAGVGYTSFSESSSWEFGAGVGAGYNFSAGKKVAVDNESFDGTDMISLALKFEFQIISWALHGFQQAPNSSPFAMCCERLLKDSHEYN